MGRAARILAALEGSRNVPADMLAQHLTITRRTLTSEMTALQASLGSIASITMSNGNYRMLVADRSGYRMFKSRLAANSGSFNDQATRTSYIVARLFRALSPVRIDDLASCMSVGRTTVVADLARVREQLQDVGLTVRGRPNVGLELLGDELSRRLHVVRHHFAMAYPPGDWLGDVEPVVSEYLWQCGLHTQNLPELSRWSTVVVDRVSSGHPIGKLPDHHRGVEGTSAFRFAVGLADRLAASFGIELDATETAFLALPAVGMRLPEQFRQEEAGNDLDALISAILRAVATEMDFDLAGSEFIREFRRHLECMLNRMRYRMWVDDSGVADIQREFPVATQMTEIARRVIENRVGLPINDAESRFLTAYFQVLLASSRERFRWAGKVAVVAPAGSVIAELLRLQLERIFAPCVELVVIHEERATAENLASYDLVVTSGRGQLAGGVPVVQVAGLLDRVSLERELERLQLHVPLLRGSGHPRSVLAGALDDDHFFALPSGTGYRDAVDFMLGHLEAKGLVEKGFAERVLLRDADGQMQLDPWVGFPHATLETQRSVMLAVGVVPRRRDEEGIRLVVLLGVPAEAGRNESTLVQVYDAVLRIGARRDLLNLLSRAQSFREFYYLLESHSLMEGEC